LALKQLRRVGAAPATAETAPAAPAPAAAAPAAAEATTAPAAAETPAPAATAPAAPKAAKKTAAAKAPEATPPAPKAAKVTTIGRTKAVEAPEAGSQITLEQMLDLWHQHTQTPAFIAETEISFPTKKASSAAFRSVFEFFRDNIMPNYTATPVTGMRFNLETIEDRMYADPRTPGGKIRVQGRVVSELRTVVADGTSTKIGVADAPQAAAG